MRGHEAETICEKFGCFYVAWLRKVLLALVKQMQLVRWGRTNGMTNGVPRFASASTTEGQPRSKVLQKTVQSDRIHGKTRGGMRSAKPTTAETNIRILREDVRLVRISGRISGATQSASGYNTLRRAIMKSFLIIMILPFCSGIAWASDLVTVHLLSNPLGAKIYSSGSKSPLGKTPYQIKANKSQIDLKSNAIAGVEYKAIWPSGAESTLLKFVGFAAYDEWIFVIPRPETVPGIEKDKSTEAKLMSNPKVAADMQMLIAKKRSTDEKVAAIIKSEKEKRDRELEEAAIANRKAEQEEYARQQEQYARQQAALMAAAAERANRQRQREAVLNMSTRLLSNQGRF